jgi:hypothetical protein
VFANESGTIDEAFELLYNTTELLTTGLGISAIFPDGVADKVPLVVTAIGTEVTIGANVVGLTVVGATVGVVGAIDVVGITAVVGGTEAVGAAVVGAVVGATVVGTCVVVGGAVVVGTKVVVGVGVGVSQIERLLNGAPPLRPTVQQYAFFVSIAH